MIIIACLIWVGVQLGAPAAFYILLGIDAIFKILALVVKLGEKKLVSSRIQNLVRTVSTRMSVCIKRTMPSS